AAGQGVRGDRVPPGRALLLRAGGRIGEARACAYARPVVREPAGAAAHGGGSADRGPDRLDRDARPDPRRHRPLMDEERDDRADRGVPDVERPPEGPPLPDQVGAGGAMGARPDVAEGWDRPADLDKDPALVPDIAETDVPDDLRGEIERLMSLYPDRRSATIPALHAAQAAHGWCSPEAIRQVAAVMRVTPAYLSSVASFYDMLN